MKKIEINDNINPDSCGICGDILVEIRGRYPKQPRRKVCPTCTYERMEMINEMTSKWYGQAYQDNH